MENIIDFSLMDNERERASLLACHAAIDLMVSYTVLMHLAAAGFHGSDHVAYAVRDVAIAAFKHVGMDQSWLEGRLAAAAMRMAELESRTARDVAQA